MTLANIFRHRHRVPPTQTRLQIERLEDRCVLSSFAEVEPNDSLLNANAVPLGFDAGENAAITVHGAIAAPGDRDWLKVQLNRGDVIGGTMVGQSALNAAVGLFDAGGTPLMTNDDHRFLFFRGFPRNDSPLPLSQPSEPDDAIFFYVITAPGAYFIEASASADASAGKYQLDLVVARPGMETQTVGTKQILYLDFDGATVNTNKFIGGGGQAQLSPLSSFLANWGLTAADENAVIDVVRETVAENFLADIRERGLNGDFAATGIPGQFDLDIRTSRDHRDEFSANPLVSRVVIGGTLEEFGISFETIGLAEVIDPGNFSFDDEAVVLLDQLSGPASEANSLNQYAIHSRSSKIELVGRALGNIATHEAGHFFGSVHTEGGVGVNNIMDGFPPFFDQDAEVGRDRVFGSPDDVDEDFGVDIFNTSREPFRGLNDTLNVMAFGLSTGKGGGGSGGSGGGGGSGAGSSGFGAFAFGLSTGKGTGTASATADLSADTSRLASGTGALSALILSAAADLHNLTGPVGLYDSGRLVDWLPKLASRLTASPSQPTTPAPAAALAPRAVLSPPLHVASVDRFLADEEDDEVDLMDEWLLDWGIVAPPEG